MGITTYLFHKSDGLGKQGFNMFFLDMGENIHFHYRDLRIELSVGEFQELAEQFLRCAREVQGEIEAGYKDGVLANTNEAGTLKTFRDKEKRLAHPVKYHERRLAVEETRDGYHLHLRNYKILLSKEAFGNFVKAIAPIAPLLEQGELVRDPVQLLAQNELHTRLVSRLATDEREEIVIEVDAAYRNKAGQVLKAIGYTPGGTTGGGTQYCKPGSRVNLVHPGHSSPEIPRPGEPAALTLPVFLARHGGQLDAVSLNRLKLKILSLLKMAVQGKIAPFRLQDMLINGETQNPAVDFFGSAEGRFPDPLRELDDFSKLVGRHKLFFIKPEKEPFSRAEHDEVEDAFFQFVMDKLATHDCVRRIYLLGSAKNRRSGRYKVPFVHFDWAKINSDFDIHIELDPDYEGPLPEQWEKKFFWPRAGCDYYHFGDIGDGMSSDYAKQYPGVRFFDHLVEGYLFHPATGNKAAKDAWFRETKARCIFHRDRVGDWVGRNYGIEVLDTEKFAAASFNKVYHVHARPADFVLKVYESKYLTRKNREKTAYEIALLDFLKEAGLEIALPVKNREGRYISRKADELAVLFTFAPGRYVTAPGREESMLAGNLLARFHEAARDFRFEEAGEYSIKSHLRYWLEAWKEYHDRGDVVGTDIPLDIAYYMTRLNGFDEYQTHCHGDLSVINYLFHQGRCWLIDFQSIAYGPALIDLANGMVEFAARKKDFLMENLDFFRQGYESVRPLTPAERDCLPDLLVIQTAVRQAKLLRLHYGGFGYDLKIDRILGLRKGLERLNPLRASSR